MTIGGTAVVSVIYALDAAGLKLPLLGDLCRKLPLYDAGFCWVSIAAVAIFVSIILNLAAKKSKVSHSVV